MNAYERLAQSYERLLRNENGENDSHFSQIDQETVQRKIKVLRIVAELSKEEIDALFDTTVFNDIVKGYFLALTEHALPILTVEQKSALVNGLDSALDKLSAAEARKKLEK